MPVTHRDLPEEIDIVAFLFGEVKFTVPESRFTPELKARFFERALESFDVRLLQSKSDRVPHGLESLQSLLRRKPDQHGKQWLKLEASKQMIEQALPDNTPYQLQYLVLFSFDIPEWHNLPTRVSQHSRAASWIVNEFTSVALLFGKNGRLYFVTATWRPKEDYFHSVSNKKPNYKTDPYVFDLSRLTVEHVEWSDDCVMKRIREGEWSEVDVFCTNLHLALSCSADVLERRAHNIRRSADRLSYDEMSIQYGQ